MKCELKIIARDIKEVIKSPLTLRGIIYFAEVLLIESIIIVPALIIAGANAVVVTVVAVVSLCIVLVYYNAMSECKEKEDN